jgi:hypothetical protein
MQKTLMEWDHMLRDVASMCRASGVDPMAEPLSIYEEGPSRSIFLVLRKGQELGSSVIPTLEALRKEMREARSLELEASKILRLVVLRLVIMVGMTAIIRVGGMPFILGSQGSGWIATYGHQDFLAFLLGCLVLVFGTAAFLVFLPHPWIWLRGPTPCAAHWVATHLLGTTTGMDPWSPRARALDERACALGVGITAELRLLLTEWSQEQNARVATRLQHMEELLPLWEMGVVGLAVALFLVVPLMQGFL